MLQDEVAVSLSGFKKRTSFCRLWGCYDYLKALYLSSNATVVGAVLTQPYGDQWDVPTAHVLCTLDQDKRNYSPQDKEWLKDQHLKHVLYRFTCMTCLYLAFSTLTDRFYYSCHQGRYVGKSHRVQTTLGQQLWNGELVKIHDGHTLTRQLKHA